MDGQDSGGYQVKRLAVYRDGQSEYLCWQFSQTQHATKECYFLAMTGKQVEVTSSLAVEYAGTLTEDVTPATNLHELMALLRQHCVCIVVRPNELFDKALSMAKELVQVELDGCHYIGYFEDRDFGLCFVRMTGAVESCIYITEGTLTQLPR